MISSIWKFIKYWYFRYLLVTELYMVEKWERVVIHIFFAIVFSLLSYFNSAVILTSINYFTQPLFEKSSLGHISTGHPFLSGGSHQNIIS